jgi:hypothetical protein
MPYSREKTRSRKARIDKYKVKRGCDICGYNHHPYALHWDHRFGDKRGNVAHMIRKHSLKVIFEEIRKCRLLCANCHFIISVGEQLVSNGYDTYEDENERNNT